MIEQISNYFTIETIYLWLNITIIPFWLVLILFPQSKICTFFVTSIFPFIFLGGLYFYLGYFFYISSYDFIGNFNLYLGIDRLKNLFSEDGFTLLFWTHFVSINLFCGGWVVKDSQKYLIPKYLTFVPLVIIYFVGPLGIFLYWLIRIFYAKKITLYD